MSYTSPDRVNWAKMRKYWKSVADPHYYAPVRSLVPSCLSNLAIIKSTRGRVLEGEFTTTGRIADSHIKPKSLYELQQEL